MQGNAETFPYEKIRYVGAGSIVYPPGGQYGPRMQYDVQLVLLHTGEMDVAIDGERFSVRPGSAALLKSGHEEMFTFSPDHDTWHRWINVHFEGLTSDQLDALEQLPFCLPISEELNRLTDLIVTLRSSYAQNSGVMRSMGLSALQLYASGRTRTLEGQGVHPSVLQTKSRIHDGYDGEISLELLAAGAGVSPEHLVRLFRSCENTTPIRYLWHYRVLRALELLSHTGLSIKEIAGRCGFKTTYHFARMVKEKTGRTPTQIRSSSWRGQDHNRQK